MAAKRTKYKAKNKKPHTVNNYRRSSKIWLIFGVLVLLIFLSFFRGDNKTKEISLTEPNSITPKTISNCADVIKEKKVLIAAEEDSLIYLQMPQDSSITESDDCKPIISAQVDWHKVSVLINNSEFSLGFTVGEGGSTDAYIDEDMGNDFVTSGTLRVRSNDQGVTMLNPIGLRLQEDYYLDHFIIRKSEPNSVFTNQEVELWKEILLNNWTISSSTL